MSFVSVPLSEICDIIMGQAPLGESYNEDGVGLPLIAGAGDFGTLAPTPKKFTTAASKISRVDDIILCIRATIGDLNWSDKVYCLGRGVAGLRPRDGLLDKNYLWHFIGANKQQLAAKGTGSTFKQVSRSHIAEWEIPLPPLAEQKRIAAILDKADAIRRKRQQAIQLADDFLRAVFLQMFGDPLNNPKSWLIKSLGELTNKITDGKHGDCADETGSGYYFISAKDVNNGIINYERARQIVKKDFDEVHRRTDLQPGDIVMVNTGATIGRVAIVLNNEKTPRTTFQKSVAVIKPKKEVLNPTFLKYVFLFCIDDFASVGSGSAIKNLLLSKMREFPIVAPPIDLQLKFEKIVSQAQISKLESDQSLDTSTTFFSALSQKAFAGQL